MSCGLKASIIAIRHKGDIDVQFEDGSVVEHVSFEDFSAGRVKDPEIKDPAAIIQHTGESRQMGNGMTATITEYRSAKNIDVSFEDGTELHGVTYAKFLRGVLEPKPEGAEAELADASIRPGGNSHDPRAKTSRVGMKNVMSNGMTATIIAYRSANDMDIQFEDGTVRTHVRYPAFREGYVSNPNAGEKHKSFPCKRSERLGDKKMMACGLEATIINYNNSGDIDVQFSDGRIRRHIDYKYYKRGVISPAYGIPDDREEQVSMFTNLDKQPVGELPEAHQVGPEHAPAPNSATASPVPEPVPVEEPAPVSPAPEPVPVEEPVPVSPVSEPVPVEEPADAPAADTAEREEVRVPEPVAMSAEVSEPDTSEPSESTPVPAETEAGGEEQPLIAHSSVKGRGGVTYYASAMYFRAGDRWEYLVNDVPMQGAELSDGPFLAVYDHLEQASRTQFYDVLNDLTRSVRAMILDADRAEKDTRNTEGKLQFCCQNIQDVLARYQAACVPPDFCAEKYIEPQAGDAGLYLQAELFLGVRGYPDGMLVYAASHKSRYIEMEDGRYQEAYGDLPRTETIFRSTQLKDLGVAGYGYLEPVLSALGKRVTDAWQKAKSKSFTKGSI